MSDPPSAGSPVVIDTGVFAAELTPGSSLIDLYAPLVTGRLAFISFQTVAEMRYGAIRRGWGQHRTRQMHASIAKAEIVWSGPELVETYALLRADCEAAGHALGQRHHDADRWIAATAIRLGIPLVAHDAVFRGAPGVCLDTAL